MSIFAIVSDQPNQALTERIENLYGYKSHMLSHSHWLVYEETTRAEVVQARIDPEQQLTLIVYGINNWWGRQKNSVWEWMSYHSRM